MKALIDIEAIKRSTNLLALIERDTKVVKVANTREREFTGPCPFCGGIDTFHIQPDYKEGARWSCQSCTQDKWEDAIGYVMYRDKCDFNTACLKLASGVLPETQPVSRPEKSSEISPPPETAWQTLAKKSISICQEALWSSNGKKALEYLRHERGLKDDTILTFKLGYSTGYNDGSFYVPKGITIPCLVKGNVWYIKVRLIPSEATRCMYCKANIPGPGKCPKCGKENKYKGVKGNSPAALYNADDLVPDELALFTEGEFDCQIAFQELNQYIPCITIGSAANIPELSTWGEYLNLPRKIIAAYDNDSTGESRSHAMTLLLGQKVKLINLPEGFKDINAAYLAGVDLFQWLKPALFFRNIDKSDNMGDS
jgi:DNA primase